MDATSIMIQMLKQKKCITSLKKDILDTWNELQKYLFDMNSVEQQVVSNDINHPKIAAMVQRCRPLFPSQENRSRKQI